MHQFRDLNIARRLRAMTFSISVHSRSSTPALLSVDAVAFIVADTIEQGKDAAEAISIEREPLPHVVGATEGAARQQTGAVTISGTAMEDQTLTASNTLADADGLGAISYQWQRDGVDIGGATGTTYTLGDADVGAQISVRASYTDGHGTAESVASAATAAVAKAPTVSSVVATGTGIRRQGRYHGGKGYSGRHR